MNLTRKVSTTTYPIVFMMVDSTDHVTGETGLTPTVTLSKNGGSYGAAAGAVSEIGGGLYALAGNATDRGTLGELWVHADGGAGVDKSDFKVDIVSHDPYGDIAEILTDTGTTIPGLLDAIKGAGWTDETLVALMTSIESGAVDEATIRSAIGLATANLDTQLAATKTVVDGIVADMASVDDITTPLSVVDDKIDAIKAKTDNLPADPADDSDIDTAIAAVKSVVDDILVDTGTTLDTLVKDIPTNAELATALGTADDAMLAALATTDGKVDSILEDTGATLPASIAAVKAKTDQLTFTVANKVDATATVDPTGIATSAALAVVDANVDAIKVKTDALDVSDITVVATVDGSTLTILRGDTWDDAHLLNLCDLTDYVSIDFIVKESKAHTDDDAIIHIRKNASGTGDGLLRLNKAAYATATDGAITIEDIPTGDITPTLKATATKDLVPGSYIYDIQVITATSVKTRTSGVLKVMSDVTRLVA